MSFIEILKVIVFGIVEGFTEALPISSTGHMIIVDEIIHFNVSPEFRDLFFTAIQIGPVTAIVVLFFRKLNPFDSRKRKEQKKATWMLWFKIAVATLPVAIVGFILDDWVDAHLYNAYVVAAMLIIYGILFIVVENKNKYRTPEITRLGAISFNTAFYIGLFQVLALIPGTSRPGATILGALILGCSRSIAAEFSLFLAIPVIYGASFLRIIKYGFAFSGIEIVYLIIGIIVSFFVSLYSIRFFLGWIKKNDLKLFGYYRIVLGIIVLLWFGISSLLA